MLGLVRARKYLQRRFGSVFVNFGEPISLAEALGAAPRRASRATTPRAPGRSGAPSSSGSAPRSSSASTGRWCRTPPRSRPARCSASGAAACSARELATRMQEIVDLLRLQDVRLTPALLRDEPASSHDVDRVLLRSDLIRSTPDPRGEILFFEESERRRARRLPQRDRALPGGAELPGAPAAAARLEPTELREDLAFWLDLFYDEFFAPRGDRARLRTSTRSSTTSSASAALERHDGRAARDREGRPDLRFLAEQTRGVRRGLLRRRSRRVLARRGRRSPAKGLERARARAVRARAAARRGGRPEASNPVTFANAIDLLVRRGVLARSVPGPGRERARDTLYERGAGFDELPALRDRLASALGEG